MRDQFLIGRFLKAYTPVYRYKERPGPPTPSFERQVLADRFAERKRRFRARQRRYVVHLQLGFLAALLLVISAFQLNIQSNPTEAYTPLEQELVTMEEIVQTRQQVTPPPPPRPPVPVVVPDDEIIEEDELDLDATLDIAEPLALRPPPPPAPEDEEETDLEDEVFVVVEQMPEMIGGLEALLKDLKYPRLAQRAGLEGTVVVIVLIEKDGRPGRCRVAKSVAKVLDDAAVAAVMKQRFEPARQRNRPVRVEMAIPVHFRLTGG
ncbi:MAG: energy transducer TonB [Rhodothermales bacterium]